jgi:hypothetical protein
MFLIFAKHSKCGKCSRRTAMRRLVEFLRSCPRAIAALGKVLFAVQDAVPRTGRGTNRTLSFLYVSPLIGNSGGAVLAVCITEVCVV